MSQRTSQTLTSRPLGPALLLSLSLLESLLAVYQWMELVLVGSGGTPVCALSESLNCAQVWSSGFASRLHSALGMPVAALGLVWGLTAFALSLYLAERVMAQKEIALPASALKLVAWVGVLSCVSFAAASFRAGAFCLTCLGTYLLVLAFAVVALRYLPGPPLPHLKPAWLLTLAVTLPLYLALLYPGLKTPRAGERVLSRVAPGGEQQLSEFLQGLSLAQKQAVSDSIAVYQRSSTQDTSRFRPRQRFGPENAPVRIVDFTDVRCGHCRALVEALAQLERVAPQGSISVEPRHFPLDQECNPWVPRSDGDSTRCTGARAQICLEGTPDYWELRRQLFEAQENLTRERVLEIASSGSVPREKLEACIRSEETQRKLEEDISYAALYRPRGTPLVLVNGREGTPAAAWLYAMALSRGELGHHALASLPPPRE